MIRLFSVLALVIAAVSFFSTSLFAHGDGCASGKCTRRCSDALGKLTLPIVELHNSGRDGDMQARQLEAANIIYKEIAPKLGLIVPDMVIKSLSATDMAALSANAGHPAPHAIDGAAVVENSQRAGNILEFVERGRGSHVQYLRDRNTFHETLIVFAHVVGHYDFAETSPLFEVRDGDRVRDSLELAQEMTSLYHTHDLESVDHFYQLILSTKYMQDLARSSFRDPKDFIPGAKGGIKKHYKNNDLFAVNADVELHDSTRHPEGPTPSILQALVYNLPATAPAYRKSLIEKFERLHRVTPAIMQTKIMNEGWATLMEYIILSHSPWSNGETLFEYAKINAGVNVPGFSNPYWLGLQAWMRIRERFMEQPTIKALSNIEQDKAFIAFCRNNIIKKHTDYSFLRFALDEKWIEDWNLLLYRDAKPEEGAGWGPPKNIAVTRNPKRVVDYIAQKFANFDWKMPNVDLVDFDYNHTGTVLFRHRAIGGVPLERDSLAKTLYVLSQILQRPVMMEAVGTNRWFVPQRRHDRERPAGIENGTYEYEYKLHVTPEGKVTVHTDEKDTKISGKEMLVAGFTSAIEAYKSDLAISYSSADQSTSIKFEDLLAKAVAGSGPAPAGLSVMGHAHTAAHAVFKYQQFLAQRSAEILRRAVAGKWPIRQSSDGKNIIIRVMPDIPEFKLDYRILNKKLKDRKSTPVDKQWYQQPIGLSLTARAETAKSDAVIFDGDDLTIGEGPYQPGDLWDKPPPGEGGEGEGEGEESEDAGEGPGNGENDPDNIKVPIGLFGQMIAESIELRNVRRTTDGENLMESERRASAAQRPTGHQREERTFEKILEKGMAIAAAEGKDPTNMDADELFKLGLLHHEPEDIVVYDKEIVMTPEMDAVIVYVADTSGSMGLEHRQIERKMVALTSAVLRVLYPALKEKFVIYDSEAKEVTRAEFFTRSLGGGTQTTSGIKVVEEILEKFPEARYNRYVQLFSDGGDFQPDEAAARAKELSELVEFFAYGHVSPEKMPMEWAPLSQAFQALANAHKEKIGFAELNLTQESLIQALRRYYGKLPVE